MPVSDPSGIAPPPPGDDRERGSDLCTRCGLCCTGALHDGAVLDPDEVEAAAAIGLPVEETERARFMLPCPKLDGTYCTIYGSRPRVCGRYRCQLLQDLQAGETSFATAAEKVATARSLADRASAVMPAGMTYPEARALAARPPANESIDPSEQFEAMRLRLAATALNLYIDRHFRNSRDGHIFELNAVGGIVEMKDE